MPPAAGDQHHGQALSTDGQQDRHGTKPSDRLPITMRLKTLFKRNLILLKRILEPGTVMSRAGSITPLRSSKVVSWSFCSERWNPVKGPRLGRRRQLRLLTSLPLIIITIIHSVSVPRPAPTTFWAQPSSVNSVSTSINSQAESVSRSSWLSRTLRSDSSSKLASRLSVVQI